MFREPIEVVTVCVGYGDFLRETAKYNAGLFDKWVVVTSPDDHETREVCRQHRLRCLPTADHTRDGDFSKGRLVERGLQHLSADAVVIHLDADIVLPASFRHDLDAAHIEPAKLYGADRFMVPSWAAWQKVVASGWPTRSGGWHPHGVGVPAGCRLGDRWAGGDGWGPIGFFQLWCRTGGGEEWRGSRAKPYPRGHGSACREDVQFFHYWDRRDRVLLPEFFVAHLDSGPSAVGANWKGRTTPRFGPPPPPAVRPVS